MDSKKPNIEREHEAKFLQFINRDGIPYEKILLKEHYMRLISILKGGNPPPYELEIQPSSTCDAGCNHCWAKELKKLDSKLGTKKAMDRIIDEALNFERDGFKIDTIKFCGSTGEPLRNPATVYAINRLQGKRDTRLFTNGIALAENKDNDAYLRMVAKVGRLNVSLDAASTPVLHRIKRGARHITLEAILEASKKIRGFSENGLSVETSYVITSENYHGIVDFVRKVRVYQAADKIRFRIDLTDRTISHNHGDEISNALKEAKSYESGDLKIIQMHSEEEVKQENQEYFNSKGSGYRCFVSRLWACIGADGNLFPCGHIVSGDAENYGSVLEHGLAKVWDSQERQELISGLPTNQCSICSPFSLRANRFLTEISQWRIEELNALNERYIKDER